MPFKVHKVDGGYKVSSPSGDKSKHPMSKEKARAQQAAIYANWDGKEDIVNEMPAWNDQDKSISSGIGKTHRMDVDNRYKKNWKKLEDWRDGEYQWRLYASNSGKSYNLHVMFDYHEIAVFNWYKEKRFWQTISAAVNKDHQGKGIAFKAYTHMIDKYMHTLSSDTTLTGETGKGSFDLWVKLGKIYQYKYIYNENNDKLTPVDGFTRDMMQYENEHFVVSDTNIQEGIRESMRYTLKNIFFEGEY